MASLRTLRRKTASVKATQKITRAMKLVSAARLVRAQERILAARPFADAMDDLIHELTYLLREESPAERARHPLFLVRPDSRRVDLVLVTADRGLCGAFNVNLIRTAIRYLKDHPEDDVRLWLVGKKGRDYFRRLHWSVAKEYVNVFQHLGYRTAEILGRDIMETYLETNTREVVFIYNTFRSRMQQEVLTTALLPFDDFPATPPERDFIYEPNKEEILEALLPRFIKAQIFRILLESQAAELAARMTAMENATENAQEVIDSLTLTMNKTRQAMITTELAEIVGGAEALG